MFRTQNNVPEIHVNNSRDFQLLCHLKDACFGGVKYTIDSLKHTANTMEMNNVLLPLLKSKVGFFSDESLAEEELRVLLNAFPSLIKNKGSKKAIIQTINAWFRLNRMSGKLISIIINNDDHLITININSLDKDTRLLDEIFKYILPTGYIVEYKFAEDSTFDDNYIFIDEVTTKCVTREDMSRIQQKAAYTTELENNLMGTVGMTYVARKPDITTI